jgi:chaperonin GroEL (HSP60 family)
MNFRRNRIDELLKEGTKHIQGVEDAVLRNLEAVSSLSDIARTSMGPNGNYYVIHVCLCIHL